MDKEFIVGKVFEKIETKKISGKANDFPKEPDDAYTIPLLTAGVENQGLARYAMRSQCPNILSNVLSVSANGVNSGVVFYHPEEFAVLQDAYAIKVRKYEIPNPEVGLYLTTVLYKALATKYDWHYKAGWNRVQEENILLPIQTDENNNPIIDETNLYHEEGFIPDWDYMEKCVAELEELRVAELEELRVAELAAYLEATGLSDYILTDEDIDALSGFISHEERDGEDALKICEEFTVEKVLKVEQTKSVIAKANLVDGDIPYVTRTVSDNGYMRPCGNVDKNNKGNCVTIGAETGVAFYQPADFVAGNKVYRLSADGLTEKHYLFLVGALNRLTKNYSYSNARIPEKIKKEIILLPIQTDENGNPVIDPERNHHPEGYIPDWEFMERYIRAIEKVVIADVVKYKDEVIEKTKRLLDKP